MLPHPLAKFEIKKYYQNKHKFNSVYLRNNLPKIKDRTFVISHYTFKSIGTHWMAFYVNGNVTYFESFGVEHMSKEIKKFIGKKYHNKYLKNTST